MLYILRPKLVVVPGFFFMWTVGLCALDLTGAISGMVEKVHDLRHHRNKRKRIELGA